MLYFLLRTDSDFYYQYDTQCSSSRIYYNCDECNFNTTSIHLLQDHVQFDHTDDGQHSPEKWSTAQSLWPQSVLMYDECLDGSEENCVSSGNDLIREDRPSEISRDYLCSKNNEESSMFHVSQKNGMYTIRMIRNVAKEVYDENERCRQRRNSGVNESLYIEAHSDGNNEKGEFCIVNEAYNTRNHKEMKHYATNDRNLRIKENLVQANRRNTSRNRTYNAPNDVFVTSKTYSDQNTKSSEPVYDKCTRIYDNGVQTNRRNTRTSRKIDVYGNDAAENSSMSESLDKNKSYSDKNKTVNIVVNRTYSDLSLMRNEGCVENETVRRNKTVVNEKDGNSMENLDCLSGNKSQYGTHCISHAVTNGQKISTKQTLKSKAMIEAELIFQSLIRIKKESEIKEECIGDVGGTRTLKELNVLSSEDFVKKILFGNSAQDVKPILSELNFERMRKNDNGTGISNERMLSVNEQPNIGVKNETDIDESECQDEDSLEQCDFCAFKGHLSEMKSHMMMTHWSGVNSSNKLGDFDDLCKSKSSLLDSSCRNDGDDDGKIGHTILRNDFNKKCCPLCSTTSDSRVTIWKHIQDKHFGLVMKCDSCPFQTKFSKVLTLHSKSHIRRKCRKCAFVATSRPIMAQHMLEHRQESRELLTAYNKNRNRPKVNGDALNLTKKSGQVVIEDAYRCLICQLGFESDSALEGHMNSVHPVKIKLVRETSTRVDSVVGGNSKDNAIFFYCILCELRFKTDDLYQDHLNLFHGQTIESENCSKSCDYVYYSQNSNRFDPSSFQTYQTFTCARCAMGFSSADHLATHENQCRQMNEMGVAQNANDKTSPSVQETQMPKKSKHFSCNLCQLNFKTSTGHVKHMEYHSISRAYQCDVCAFRYKSEIALKKHLKRHQLLRKYKCTMCTRGFNTLDSFRRHRQQHFRMKMVGEKDDEKTSSKMNVISTSTSAHKIESSALSTENNKFGQIPSRKVRSHFSCEVCNLYFVSSTGHSKHMELHSSLREHQCDVCNLRFSAKQVLEMHKKCHLASRLFKCTMCTRGFNTIPSFRQHRQQHFRMKLVAQSTPQSSISTDVPQHIALGLEQTIVNSSPSSSSSNVAEATWTPFGRHSKSKSTENNRYFVCTFCQKKMKSRREMSEHLNSHAHVFMCGGCDTRFQLYKSFWNHLKNCQYFTGTRYSCACKKTFPELSDLREHMKGIYPESRFESKPNTVHRKALATERQSSMTVTNQMNEQMICGSSVEKKSKVKLDLSPVIVLSPLEMSSSANASRKKLSQANVDQVRAFCRQSTFVCDICTKYYDRCSVYRRHMDETHPEVRHRYRCAECSFWCDNIRVLSSHAKTHRRYLTCISCDKAFTRRYFLLKHLSTCEIAKSAAANITKDKSKFKPPLSVKTSTTTVARKVPKLSVLKSKIASRRCQVGIKLQCRLCLKHFTSKDSLTNHLKAFHTEPKHSCQICGEKFPRPDYVKIHIARVHKEEE